MTYYATCKNCTIPTGTCNRRAEVKAAISGLHVTSIKFKCAERIPAFHRGQRVEVRFEWHDDFDGYDFDWPGTVIKESGTKFLIKIDDCEIEDGVKARDFFRNKSLYCKVAADRIHASSESDIPICPACDAPKGQFVGSCYGPPVPGGRSIEGCFFHQPEATQ